MLACIRALALSSFALRFSATATSSARSMMSFCFSIRSCTSSPRSSPSRSRSGRSMTSPVLSPILVSRFVSMQRILVYGRGKSKPVVPEDSNLHSFRRHRNAGHGLGKKCDDNPAVGHLTALDASKKTSAPRSSCSVSDVLYLRLAPLWMGRIMSLGDNMPAFEVSQRRGWYEAECKELGLKITARHMEEVEATARRSAVRALGADAIVSMIKLEPDNGLLRRLVAFLRW